MHARLFSASFVVTTLFGLHAFGWGQYGHQQINHAAIQLIKSKPLAACFATSSDYITRAATIPDYEWKRDVQVGTLAFHLSDEVLNTRKENDPYEHDLHFFEADSYLNAPPSYIAGEIQGFPFNPFDGVVDQYRQRLSSNAAFIKMMQPKKALINPANPSIAEVAAHGTAPWRIRQLISLSIDSLAKNDLPRALLYMGSLGHYVGDMSQPFHTTLNYDGQYSESGALGRGIHSLVDTKIFPKMSMDPSRKAFIDFSSSESHVLDAASKYSSSLPTVIDADNVVKVLLALIDDGYPYVDDLLKTYRSKCSEENSKEGLGSDLRAAHSSSKQPYCSVKLVPEGEREPPPRPLPAEVIRGLSAQIMPDMEVRLGKSSAILSVIWSTIYAEAQKKRGSAPDLSGCHSQTQMTADNESFSILNYPRPDGTEFQGYLPAHYLDHAKPTSTDTEDGEGETNAGSQ